MSRAPAKFRQADLARVLRAIKAVGAVMRVKIEPDGSIVLESRVGDKPDQVVESNKQIVL